MPNCAKTSYMWYIDITVPTGSQDKLRSELTAQSQFTYFNSLEASRVELVLMATLDAFLQHAAILHTDNYFDIYFIKYSKMAVRFLHKEI